MRARTNGSDYCEYDHYDMVYATKTATKQNDFVSRQNASLFKMALRFWLTEEIAGRGAYTTVQTVAGKHGDWGKTHRRTRRPTRARTRYKRQTFFCNFFLHSSLSSRAHCLRRSGRTTKTQKRKEKQRGEKAAAGEDRRNGPYTNCDNSGDGAQKI